MSGICSFSAARTTNRGRPEERLKWVITKELQAARPERDDGRAARPAQGK